MFQTESQVFDSNPVLAWLGNIASAGAILASFVGWIPAVAALIALTWYVIQIVESRTFQRWLRNRHLRKLLHAKSKIIELEARLGHDEASDKEFWHKLRTQSQTILDEIEKHRDDQI
jgi:hypothetical protein